MSAYAALDLLSLNTKKIMAIVLGTRHTVRLIKKLSITDIVVNSKGNTVPFVKEVLSLGVILDGTLSWKQQANYVSKKLNRLLYSLRFLRSCTS